MTAKGLRHYWPIALLILLAISLCLWGAYTVYQGMTSEKSSAEERIRSLFGRSLPPAARLVYSDVDQGFEDGFFTYIYELPDETLRELADNQVFEGWHPLPAPDGGIQSTIGDANYDFMKTKVEASGYAFPSRGYYLVLNPKYDSPHPYDTTADGGTYPRKYAVTAVDLQHKLWFFHAANW